MKNYNSFKSSDLTIVLCAYKECPYLSLAIESLINQTKKVRL